MVVPHPPDPCGSSVLPGAALAAAEEVEAAQITPIWTSSWALLGRRRDLQQSERPRALVRRKHETTRERERERKFKCLWHYSLFFDSSLVSTALMCVLSRLLIKASSAATTPSFIRPIRSQRATRPPSRDLLWCIFIGSFCEHDPWGSGSFFFFLPPSSSSRLSTYLSFLFVHFPLLLLLRHSGNTEWAVSDVLFQPHLIF